MLKKGITNRRRLFLVGSSFVLPWIIGYLVFTLYPIIYSVILSVCDLDFAMDGLSFSFAGAKFYRRALQEDTKFSLFLVESVSYILYATPIITVISLLLALLLNGKYKGRTLFRALFFMPVVIMSGPVISQLLSKYQVNFSVTAPSLYNLINSVPELFKSPCMFVLDNLVTVFWYSGVQILLFLISLQRISPELYEAASIDGAGKWEQFWKITLPYVAPMIILCAFYTIIELANDSTNSVNKYIANRLTDISGYYSFSAAMSWIYTLSTGAILIVLYVVFLFFGKRSDKS